MRDYTISFASMRVGFPAEFKLLMAFLTLSSLKRTKNFIIQIHYENASISGDEKV